jgi:hypothetical protein
MKKREQPKLRIVRNNLEFERHPVARILDAQPTILHEFERFMDEVQELYQRSKDLEERKAHEVSKEIDNVKKAYNRGKEEND